MLEGYPLRKYSWVDWLLIILTSSLILQVIVTLFASNMAAAFPNLFVEGNATEMEIVSRIVYLGTVSGTILSLPFTLFIVHWRKIPLFNRKRLRKEESFILRGLSKEDWKFLVKYIPISYILYLLGNGVVINIFGEGEAINQVAIENMFDYIPAWQMFIMIVVVAPIVEELLFRGMMLFSGARLETTWLRIILSSILFGLIHNPTNISSLYAYVGMGFIFSYAGKRTNSVEGPMVYHFMNNLLAFMSILSFR